MRNKILVIGKSLLWCILILLFPITSGVLSVCLSLDTVEILFLQGCFMLLALLPPILPVLKGKWHWSEIGFAEFNSENCRRSLYFIPVLIIFIPAAIKGFYIKSAGYVLGSLFLYFFVGLSEELYFRGIIPRYLKKEFSHKGIVTISTFIFGWLAIEITSLSANIIPAVLLHFFFDFETKITALNGKELLIAESVRGMLMFIIAVWLAVVIRKAMKRVPAFPG